MICNVEYDTKAKQKLSYKNERRKLSYKNERTNQYTRSYKIQSFPKLKREANTQLTMQASKSGSVQGFGQNNCKLVLGVNVAKVDVALFIMVSQKMKANIYVFGFGVKNQVVATLMHWCCHKVVKLSQKIGQSL